MKTEDYCQGDAFQAEKRTIFSDSWLPVCAEGQLARSGDFLAASVGGWSVVAVRDAAGTVRVLRNACRHQNMPVVGTPSGNCDHFRCRFHGWTYDLAGKFVTAPPPVAPPAAQTERDLASLATVHEAGLVFFSLGKPTDHPRLGGMPAYGGTLMTEIDCNWKVLVEHLLSGRPHHAETFIWQEPLLALRRAGATAVVEQVVPHTFLRTRLFTHVFGDTADTHAQAAGTIKHICERLQADRALGVMMTDATAPVAAFHRRLEELQRPAR
jgi:phenylpropionate dioxygenase-like ring-hydroxylating dioxygenase large terminal subunit